MKSRPLGMPVKPSRGHNYACNCIFCFLFFLRISIRLRARRPRRTRAVKFSLFAGTSSSLLMLLKPATETCGSLLAPFCSLFAPLSPSPELLFSLFFFCFCSLLKNRALEPVFLRSTIY